MTTDNSNSPRLAEARSCSWNCSKDHAAHVKNKQGLQLTFVRGKRHAYVWVGTDDHVYGTIDGAKQLRAFAKAILEEVPDV